MITRKKEKDSLKKRKYFPSSDIESSPISKSHHRKGKKPDHRKKPKETKFQLSDQMKKHNMLEILEFRIHFDQDPIHGHPAQSVSILDELPEHKITDMNEEESSMKFSYKLINPIQIIPDFWPERVYDEPIEPKSLNGIKKISNQAQDNTNNHLASEDENESENGFVYSKYYDNNPQIIPVIKLSKKESQQLLEKMIAESDVNLKYKSKQKKNQNKHNQKISIDRDGDFSNPDDEDDDDEFDKNEMKKLTLSDISINKRTRSQYRYKKNRKEIVLSLPSLLYDTDESCDETDGELF